MLLDPRSKNYEFFCESTVLIQYINILKFCRSLLLVIERISQLKRENEDLLANGLGGDESITEQLAQMNRRVSAIGEKKSVKRDNSEFIGSPPPAKKISLVKQLDYQEDPLDILEENLRKTTLGFNDHQKITKDDLRMV